MGYHIEKRIISKTNLTEMLEEYEVCLSLDDIKLIKEYILSTGNEIVIGEIIHSCDFIETSEADSANANLNDTGKGKVSYKSLPKEYRDYIEGKGLPKGWTIDKLNALIEEPKPEIPKKNRIECILTRLRKWKEASL